MPPGPPGQPPRPPGRPPAGFGWGPGGPPPRRKKNSGAAVIAVVLGAAVLIGVIAVPVAFDGGEEKTDPWANSTPSATPSPETTNTSAGDDADDPGGTDDPNEGDTQEPDYTAIVKENPFYATGAHQSVSCREAGSGMADRAAAEAYYQAIFDCLDRAWPAQIQEGGAEYRTPTILTWSGSSVETPCTGGASLAFYCSANETIYMKWDDDVNRYNEYPGEPQAEAFARMVATHTAAHEFAHHIQTLTGILDAYHTLRYEAATEEQALEYSRRAELQASCIGDVFLGANQPSYPITGLSRDMWAYVVENSGDEHNSLGIRDHGSTRSHAAWAMRGFQTEDVGSCNTFTASSESVS